MNQCCFFQKLRINLFCLTGLLLVAFLGFPAYAVAGQESPPTDMGRTLAVQMIAYGGYNGKSPFAFHGIPWKMDYAEVKKKEEGAPEQEVEGSLLGYRKEFGKSSLFIVYIFDESAKLAAIDCFFHIPRPQSQFSVQDFNGVLDALRDAYGKEQELTTEFLEGIEAVSEGNLASSYEAGDAVTKARWDFPGETTMFAIIGGDEAGVSLSVTFALN